MADAATRPNRAEEVRQERRRKPGNTTHSGIKLGVPEEHLDRKTYEYRFVNDTGTRVQGLKDNDWDPVGLEGASTESRFVGTDSGKPVKAVLMRKRKDWYDADQKEKRKPLDEMEQAILRGVAHKNEADLKGDGVAYTPGDGNSISRG